MTTLSGPWVVPVSVILGEVSSPSTTVFDFVKVVGEPAGSACHSSSMACPVPPTLPLS